jgi:transcriptional regulator with XRE-family HTH domain
MADSSNLFGRRLKELREQAGLTQPQLAERANLSKAGIADLEQGRREPAWSTVQALCAALGVSCEAFNQPPAERPDAGPGRPTKHPTGEAEAQAPKRPRRRPKEEGGKVDE